MNTFVTYIPFNTEIIIQTQFIPHSPSGYHRRHIPQILISLVETVDRSRIHLLFLPFFYWLGLEADFEKAEYIPKISLWGGGAIPGFGFNCLGLASAIILLILLLIKWICTYILESVKSL
jgi:hypothetical protein